MRTEPIDTVHDEKEGEALNAGQQEQDSPQNLQDNDMNNMKADQVVFTSNSTPGGKGLPNSRPIAKVPIDTMSDLIKRHCVLTNEEVDAIVLWLISSYLINDFRIFPKLSLISPEKRCGKTTTMEIIHSLSKKGILASSISGAAIYRITEQLQPTLFIDEADTFLKNGDQQLVGLVNSSHTKSAATVIRCSGENYNATPYSTWMPMVLASIGDLPPTIMDRSVVINLRRKKAHEPTDRVPVNIKELQEKTRNEIQAWCNYYQPLIQQSLVKPPDSGNDRASDNWVPMFTIARFVSGSWPDRCKRAYRKLTTINEPEIPTQLLIDIHHFFQSYEKSRVSSASLMEHLCKDPTKPWQTYNNGRCLTQNQMAQILRPYNIRPKTLRIGDATPRGYDKIQFKDAFDRYLP
jgi:hypothetical protein